MLVVECDPARAPERRYVLDVVLGELLGLEHRVVERPGDEVVVRAGDDGRRVVLADVLLRDGGLALPVEPLARCEVDAPRLLGPLPVLYGEPTVELGPDEARIGIDLLGGAFALLTRLEEAGDGPRDAHRRFPAEASLAVREGFLERPLVNEYAELLWWALHHLWPRLERPRRAFRLLPTHDVDWPWYSRGRLAETARDALDDVRGGRGARLAATRLRSLLAVRRRGREADPCATFDFLLDESEARGLTSAFYLMTGDGETAHDPRFGLDDPWLVAFARRAVDRGHELGVHPGYATFRDPAAIRAAAARVHAATGLEPRGGRQHYLRFAVPDTWRAWEEAGLDYDSTVGFSAAPGFRSGTCTEHPVFDLRDRRTLRLRERPLVAMEASLLDYQGLDPEAAADGMRRLREVCRAFDGDFVFLWHNNRLEGERERAAYRAVLD